MFFCAKLYSTSTRYSKIENSARLLTVAYAYYFFFEKSMYLLCHVSMRVPRGQDELGVCACV